MGEQLLPSAPTQRSGKPLPTLPSFSRAFFPSIEPPSQNNLCPSLCIILGRRLSGFQREEEEERSWAAHGHRLLAVCWVWKAQRFCNTVLVFACGLLNHNHNPIANSIAWETGREQQQEGKERRGSRRKRKERRKGGDGTCNSPVTFISFS